MIIGESLSQRMAREERQAQTYPELGVADVPTVLQIDDMRRQEGRAPTSFGMAVDSVYSRLRPPTEDNPAGELLNPAMGPVGPMGPYGQPTPPSTGNPGLDAQLARQASGFGDRNVGQADPLGAVSGVADRFGGWLSGRDAQPLTPEQQALVAREGFNSPQGRQQALQGAFDAASGAAGFESSAVSAGQKLVPTIASLAGSIAAPYAANELLPEDIPMRNTLLIGSSLAGAALGGKIGSRAPGVSAPQPETAPPPPKPSSVSEELYGLTPATPEPPNRFTQAIDNLKRATRVGVPSDEIATPIMETRARVKTVADSLAARIGSVADEVSGAFQTDKYGRVTTIPGAPTIQDIAADLTRYADDLTPRQADAMNRLRAEVEPIGNAVREQGVEFGTRADVKEGGFYLPRGNAAVEGWDAPVKVRSGSGSGKAGYRKAAEFETQAQGIESGYEYTPFPEAMKGYARQGANDTVDAWAANQFKATGLGEAGTGFRDKGVIGLPGMQGVSFPDEIANVANKMLNSEKPTQGKLAGVVAVKNAIDAMARMAGSTLDFSGMGLQGLLGLSVDPRAYGTAIKVGMKSLANPQAIGSYLKEFDERALANGTPTSRDFIKAGQRFGGSVTEFTGQGVPQRVERVIESSLPLTDKIVKGGLNPVRGANRQFGALGDVLRNELSDTSFQIARAKGGDGWSQLPEIVNDANKMTGWTKRRLGGDLGEFVNYAPRWMEANLETLVDAGRGALPGANIGQQQARNAILRLVGAGTLITFAINEAQGQETDTRLIVDGRDNPNFMRARVGGYDVSLFGFFDRLVHLMAKAATGDGEGVARSLVNAPTMGAAWDLIAGENAIGERTRDTPEQLAKTVGSRAFPMSANEYISAGQAAIEGDSAKAATAAVVGATGLRGTPLSTSEQVQEGKFDTLTGETKLKAIPAEVWRALGNPDGHKSYYDWKRSRIEADVKMLVKEGVPEWQARQDAEKAIESDPISESFSQMSNDLERQWSAEHPEELQALLEREMKKNGPDRRIPSR